jgi:hypothetical protein
MTEHRVFVERYTNLSDERTIEVRCVHSDYSLLKWEMTAPLNDQIKVWEALIGHQKEAP